LSITWELEEQYFPFPGTMAGGRKGTGSYFATCEEVTTQKRRNGHGKPEAWIRL
jgi:hypothetical protein